MCAGLSVTVPTCAWGHPVPRIQRVRLCHGTPCSAGLGLCHGVHALDEPPRLTSLGGGGVFTGLAHI